MFIVHNKHFLHRNKAKCDGENLKMNMVHVYVPGIFISLNWKKKELVLLQDLFICLNLFWKKCLLLGTILLMKSAYACDYRWISMADLNMNTAVIWMYNDTSYDYFFFVINLINTVRPHQVTQKQYTCKLKI